MTYGGPVRTAPGVRRISVVCLLVVAVAVAAALGYHSWTSSSLSSTATSPGLRANGPAAPRRPPGAIPRRAAVKEHGGALGEADGAIPYGTTVVDDEVPGVVKLDPALLDALRRAATDAADDGVEFTVDSRWRSSEYQEELLQQAVSRYGSASEAARWVATPDTSEHVKGDAVDLGSAAATWLSVHGAEYGLCRIYGNEPWHFELRPEAVDHGCPATYADPTQDPRMQGATSQAG